MFTSRGEVYQPAYGSFSAVRDAVEPSLNAALASSSLAGTEAAICYIPIVMGEEARARYPARSRLKKKERLYYCCPQLDYETFVSGTWEAQVACYLDGLRECSRRLPELGATKEQVQEFLDILERAKLEIAQEPGRPPTVH